MPAGLQTALTLRGCLVPEPPAGLPRDSAGTAMLAGTIARAALLGPRSREWVVVCAHGEEREMLVYPDSVTPTREPVAVRRFFFRDEGDDGCEAWFRVVGPTYTAERLADGILSDVDATLTAAERAQPPHDGLVDDACDGASVIHYWTGTRWVLLPGAD